MTRTNYIVWDDDDDVYFELDQNIDFYSGSLLKQQSAGRHVAPLRGLDTCWLCAN
jgi:hypothetical protein